MTAPTKPLAVQTQRQKLLQKKDELERFLDETNWEWNSQVSLELDAIMAELDEDPT